MNDMAEKKARYFYALITEGVSQKPIWLHLHPSPIHLGKALHGAKQRALGYGLTLGHWMLIGQKKGRGQIMLIGRLIPQKRGQFIQQGIDLVYQPELL